MAEIKQLVNIKASPQTVYEAVTEQQGLSSWWTRDTLASPKVGTIIEFKFGEEYHIQMRVTYLESNRRVEWECIKDSEEWIGTCFVFDIEEGEKSTILRFTHGNWRGATDFFASCNYNWGIYMKSLKQYCETGEGEPFE